MGPTRFELVTSSLSGTRSNQLSYEPGSRTASICSKGQEILGRRPGRSITPQLLTTTSPITIVSMISLKRIWPLLALALAGGCATIQRFDITVTNRLSEPVTVWLTKLHGPYEDGWEPPEQLALET